MAKSPRSALRAIVRVLTVFALTAPLHAAAAIDGQRPGAGAELGAVTITAAGERVVVAAQAQRDRQSAPDQQAKPAAPQQASPAASEPAQTRPPVLFYFYSPDWRPGNLNLLTETMEDLIRAEAFNVRFQAFARYQDFLARIKEKLPEFLVAPSWFEQARPAGMEVTLLARPVRAGKTSYRKALMTRPGIARIEDLTHGSIAATAYAMGPAGARSVLEAFNLDPTTTTVIPVPKDIDALLALSFDQVDAALVTSAQFEALNRINQNITKDLTVLAFSPDIEFPGVYATQSATPLMQEKMTALLSGLSLSESGRRLLDLLGYEAMATKTTRPGGRDRGQRAAGAEESPQ